MERVITYIANNWIKVLILILAVSVFVHKDISFRVQMKPAGASPAPDSMVPAPVASRGLLDRLSFGWWGSSRPAGDAMQVLDQAGEPAQRVFLRRFEKVAVSEQLKYGVPASVILANALLQSQAGRRDAAYFSNNYFGLGCDTYWMGATHAYEGTCFRHYNSAWESFRDHSLYITTGNYAVLRKLSPLDYKGWAKGLESLGFPGGPSLAANLITIIERYQLNALDNPSLSAVR